MVGYCPWGRKELDTAERREEEEEDRKELNLFSILGENLMRNCYFEKV